MNMDSFRVRFDMILTIFIFFGMVENDFNFDPRTIRDDQLGGVFEGAKLNKEFGELKSQN